MCVRVCVRKHMCTCREDEGGRERIIPPDVDHQRVVMNENWIEQMVHTTRILLHFPPLIIPMLNSLGVLSREGGELRQRSCLPR